MLPANFPFSPWLARPMAPEPVCLLALLFGIQAGFWVVLVWADPIGRLIRSRPSRRLLVFACLAAPGLAYLPHIIQDQWMRSQIAPLVGQRFKLLWNERHGNYGVVVILRHHPVEVDQALRDRLKLGPQNKLSVVCIDCGDRHEMPPFMPWASAPAGSAGLAEPNQARSIRPM